MKKSDAKPNTKSCDRILHILFPFLFFSLVGLPEMKEEDKTIKLRSTLMPLDQESLLGMKRVVFA